MRTGGDIRPAILKYTSFKAICMFTTLEIALISLLHTLPLEVFAFVASFIEEVIAPIPSPTVMVLTGSAASVQEYTLYGLIVLALIAALGKTLGALVVYTIADRGENFILEKFSRFSRVSHTDIERLGAHLRGDLRDYVLLTTLRALPFIPSVVVSVGSGLLKVEKRLFIVSTILGTIIRDSVYLYFGFVGTDVLGDIITGSASVETAIEIGALMCVVIGFVYLYMRRK